MVKHCIGGRLVRPAFGPEMRLHDDGWIVAKIDDVTGGVVGGRLAMTVAGAATRTPAGIGDASGRDLGVCNPVDRAPEPPQVDDVALRQQISGQLASTNACIE